VLNTVKLNKWKKMFEIYPFPGIMVYLT